MLWVILQGFDTFSQHKLLGESLFGPASHGSLWFCHYVKLASELSIFPGSLDETQRLDMILMPTHVTLSASVSIFLTLTKSQTWDAINGADGHHIHHQLISCLCQRLSNHTWQFLDNKLFEMSLAFCAVRQNSNCHSLSGCVIESDKVNYAIQLKR